MEDIEKVTAAVQDWLGRVADGDGKCKRLSLEVVKGALGKMLVTVSEERYEVTGTIRPASE